MREVAELLGERAGLRVSVDERAESVGRKIRDAELAKLPLMIVVGDREAERCAASVRSHERGDLGALPLADWPRPSRGRLGGHG